MTPSAIDEIMKTEYTGLAKIDAGCFGESFAFLRRHSQYAAQVDDH